MIDASDDIKALLASRPENQFIANLFTFELFTGETFRFTDAPRDIIIGGDTYVASATKVLRGRVKLTRGLSVDSQQVQIQEKNGTFIGRVFDGYFDLAKYTMARVFAADAVSPWLGPVVRFVGQIASVDEMGSTYAKLTAKSMLNVLDNDFPRILLQTDCPHVLFDAGCGLSRSAYISTGEVQAGSTQNTVNTNVIEADDFFDQGIISFTSGALSGISYMVKKSTNAAGTIYPAYPLLTAPAAGDEFSISPGCDKTLATCESKYGLDPSAGTAPFFGGTPYIPDPTTSY